MIEYEENSSELFQKNVFSLNTVFIAVFLRRLHIKSEASFDSETIMISCIYFIEWPCAACRKLKKTLFAVLHMAHIF